MKRTYLVASFGLALILLLTMVVPAMAKPIDHGYNWAYMYSSVDDAQGHDWYIYVLNYHDGTPGFVDIYSEDLGIDIYAYANVTSRVNMNRGIATFQSSYCDLRVTCTNSSYFNTWGSHKDGAWGTYYNWGPGTIKGTVTYNQNVYTVNITITGNDLYLEERHVIEK